MLRVTSTKATRYLRSSSRCILQKPTVFRRSYPPRQIHVSVARHASTTIPQGTSDSFNAQPPPQLTRSDAQKKTIYALSTPPGKAGVAVVRVSGPDALEVWRKMVRPYQQRSQPIPWKLERCRMVNPENPEEVIDDGLSVFFRAPKSFTKEPTLELHTHSGRALLTRLLGALSTLSFLRPAEPGEFTKRAFLNGRLDLTEVEGLADLIDAETEEQRKFAGRGAWGETRKVLDDLRTCAIHCLAQVEALIDFGEGEDLEEGVYDQARNEAELLLARIRAHLADNRRGEIIRSGIKLAIFGPPNAGKSSLLNYLAQREAAIVTPIPGTTRDVLQLTLDIGGMPVIVADTAGLRKTEDLVETIGIEKGVDAIKDADISLCVLSLPDILVPATQQGSTNSRVIRLPDTIRELALSEKTYFILNKVDLVDGDLTIENLAVDPLIPPSQSPLKSRAWILSLSKQQGTSNFLTSLGQELHRLYSPTSSGSDRREARNIQAPIITRARHRVHLESACSFLQAFLECPQEDIVFAAEELRYAVRALGRVTGAIDVEDILDAVFRDFCIGK